MIGTVATRKNLQMSLKKLRKQLSLGKLKLPHDEVPVQVSLQELQFLVRLWKSKLMRHIQVSRVQCLFKHVSFIGVWTLAPTKKYSTLLHPPVGLSRPITHAPAYVGATLFLPQDHALRHLAVEDMPEGYFDGDAARNTELGRILTALARATPVRGDKDLEEEAAAELEDNAIDENDIYSERDHSYLRGPHPKRLPEGLSWISEKYPYDFFSEAIDPPVTDPRERQDFFLDASGFLPIVT
eukprot:gene21782-27848_t